VHAANAANPHPAVGTPFPAYAAHGGHRGHNCGSWQDKSAHACSTSGRRGFSIFALLTGLAALGLVTVTGFGVAQVKHHAEAVFATNVPLAAMPHIAALPLLVLIPAGVLFLLNLWSRRRATVKGYCGRGFATVGIVATLIVSGMAISMHSRLSDISEPWEQLSEQASMGLPTARAQVDKILTNSDAPAEIYHAMEIKALYDLETVEATVAASTPVHRQMAIRVLGQINANRYAAVLRDTMIADSHSDVRIEAARQLQRTPVAVDAFQALIDTNQKSMLVNNGRATADVPVLVAVAQMLQHRHWDPAARELIKSLQSHPDLAVVAAARSRAKAKCGWNDCNSMVEVTVTSGPCGDGACDQTQNGKQACESKQGCAKTQKPATQQVPTEASPSRIYLPGKSESVIPALPLPSAPAAPAVTDPKPTLETETEIETDEQPELPPFNDVEDF
jgi:hypothetical protein